MKEVEQNKAQEVPQTLASEHCKLHMLNSTYLYTFLIEDVDVEVVAMLIDQGYRHGDQVIRWGMVYRSCMDSGIFAPMGKTQFWKMSRNLIPDFSISRPTFSKGVDDYDMRVRDYRKDAIINSDDITYIKYGEIMVEKLRDLKGQAR